MYKHKEEVAIPAAPRRLEPEPLECVRPEPLEHVRPKLPEYLKPLKPYKPETFYVPKIPPYEPACEPEMPPYCPEIPPCGPEMPPCGPEMPFCGPELPYDCHEYHVYPSNPPFDPCNPYTYACSVTMMDYGPSPFFVDIYQASLQNNNFRTALWTGCNLQLTLMCIPPCEEIGLELHPDVEQFICITEGQGLTLMGDTRDHLFDRQIVGCNCAVFIPAGTWHNIINTGNVPLKLYSIYAPPQHPRGTVHMRRDEVIAAEG